MIRLAVFDLDQTLIGDDLRLSPGVKEAVARALERGVTISLVTGRRPRVTRRFALELGLNAPVVCYQGSAVYDFQQNRYLREVRLPAKLVPRVISAADRYNWNLHFEVDSHLYLPRVSNHPPIFFELIRVAEWSRVDDFEREMPPEPHKFIVTLNQPDERARVVEEMENTFGGQVSVVPSHDFLVEGLPAGVDKSHGLAWLADYFRIEREQVLAVGDNDNDIPMINWAGVGVAMGNASPAARAAADWIAPPLEQDGAAAAIHKYILDL